MIGGKRKRSRGVITFVQWDIMIGVVGTIVVTMVAHAYVVML